MALKGTLPVRLTSEQDEKLQKLAAQSGVTKSSLVRMLVTSFLDQIGDKPLFVGPKWELLLNSADGRAGGDRKTKITAKKSGILVVGDNAKVNIKKAARH